MSSVTYQGGELELFAEAEHWKHYFRSQLSPLLKGRVLEVGAGIGGSTSVLCDGTQQQWLCLEPDESLFKQLVRSKQHDCVEYKNGTIAALGSNEKFDLILYIDVLEHIEDDSGELIKAADHLASGGRLAVLSPAHSSLYTEFDRAIGHYRRYNKSTLKAVAPAGLQLQSLRYLDSVGLLASLGNKLLLRSAMPTRAQIGIWDRLMVPISGIIDPCIRYSLGKVCSWCMEARGIIG